MPNYHQKRMDNDFTRELVVKIVSCTLFENTNLNEDKLYFSQEN